MIYGMNPIFTRVSRTRAERWATKNPSRDYSTFGVSGSTTIVGVRRVTVPAGSFDALVVQSTLTQAGFKYGSGRARRGSRPARAS